jgi:glycosyltransferase involved in cell wall biosynthesis
MSTLVSICIPNYNNARWLKQAIDSALAQTCPVQVIVADDGSTDTSILVAGAYGDRIKLVRSPHRGATAARNEALQHATGDWVQFLDADDYLEPDKIERQLAEADGGEIADILYSPVIIEDSTGKQTKRSVSAIDPTQDLFVQWLSWELPQTGGALWRREALEEIGGWRKEQPCCQEHELYLRALIAGLRFQHTPTPGAVYRIWSDGTLCRKDPMMVVRQKTRLIDDLRRWMEEKQYWTEAHRQAAGRACFEMARTLAKTSLRDAQKYYSDRARQRLIRLSGPAAPLAYRAVHLAFGFTVAELLAKALR